MASNFEDNSIDKSSQYLGHRSRLRQRFDEVGADGLMDYELLELLLFRSIPRRDTKPIAKELIAKHGSLAEVIAAPPKRLEEIKGLGKSVVGDLKVIHAVSQRMISSQLSGKKLLDSWEQLINYCRAVMAFEEKEQFRILFLDKKSFLIRDEVQQVGTIDHTPVYPREVVKRALELSASAIILLHNHPSGDPTPSSADVQMTKHIIRALETVGIEVFDHIIIGKYGHSSLKGMQLI